MGNDYGLFVCTTQNNQAMGANEAMAKAFEEPPGSNGSMTIYPGTTGYQQAFALLQAHTGLQVHNGRFDEIAHVIDDVLASMRPADVNDLVLALSSSSFTEPLWQTFIQAITVGETYFFRDQGQMDALRTHILPQLIAERQKTGNKQLRLWSAGCATGEEPYSLVMLLYELLPDIENWRITVLGTDINLAFLERAKRGLYRTSSFRNETPEYVQKRWFRLTSEGYQLDQAIRDKVTFLPLNLANNSHPLFENFTMNMDLIVCRNVTIYFDQATVRDSVDRFYRALNDAGRLMVGHSELSTTIYHKFSTRNYKRIVYYQKDAVSQNQRDTSPATPSPAERLAVPLPAVAPPPFPKPAPPPLPDAEESQDQTLEAAWSRAKEAADRERWDEALAYLLQVAPPHMFRPEFHYLHGLVQMAAENADKALWAWRQALYCDPMFALAHYSLGELYEQRGEHKIAARHWHQAMAAIAELEPQHRLLFSEDITVEMLQGLLNYRVSGLPSGDERE
jgi:chemotaxis protein methyltransferase CheR